MANKAKRFNLNFRPHFKTHQSAIIGNWFRDYGVSSITVSSVSMAEYFAANGWTDITIAFPVNILELENINNLNERVKLNLLVDSEFVLGHLEKNLRKQVNLFIKIDTGYNRSGISFSDTIKIDAVVKAIHKSSKLNFAGFLTHEGQTYKVGSKEELSDIHNQSIQKLKKLKSDYSNDFAELCLSIGDTPACTTEDNFDGVDEIRPGNFVFYDVMQHVMGVCNADQIAVCLASPVVSMNHQRQEAVVYGGAIHLSKEYTVDKTNNKLYGLIVEVTDEGWSEPLQDCYVKWLSQEHGIIRLSEQVLQNVKPSDLLGILPIHSCLAANLMKEYITLDNQKIPMMR